MLEGNQDVYVVPFKHVVLGSLRIRFEDKQKLRSVYPGKLWKQRTVRVDGNQVGQLIDLGPKLKLDQSCNEAVITNSSGGLQGPSMESFSAVMPYSVLG